MSANATYGNRATADENQNEIHADENVGCIGRGDRCVESRSLEKLECLVEVDSDSEPMARYDYQAELPQKFIDATAPREEHHGTLQRNDLTAVEARGRPVHHGEPFVPKSRTPVVIPRKNSYSSMRNGAGPR